MDSIHDEMSLSFFTEQMELIQSKVFLSSVSELPAFNIPLLDADEDNPGSLYDHVMTDIPDWLTGHDDPSSAYFHAESDDMKCLLDEFVNFEEHTTLPESKSWWDSQLPDAPLLDPQEPRFCPTSYENVATSVEKVASDARLSPSTSNSANEEFDVISIAYSERLKVRRSTIKRSKTYNINKFNTEQILPLLIWLDAHLLEPYPELVAETTLATLCNLTHRQVRSWFNRARQKLRASNNERTQKRLRLAQNVRAIHSCLQKKQSHVNDPCKIDYPSSRREARTYRHHSAPPRSLMKRSDDTLSVHRLRCARSLPTDSLQTLDTLRQDVMNDFNSDAVPHNGLYNLRQIFNQKPVYSLYVQASKAQTSTIGSSTLMMRWSLKQDRNHDPDRRDLDPWVTLNHKVTGWLDNLPHEPGSSEFSPQPTLSHPPTLGTDPAISLEIPRSPESFYLLSQCRKVSKSYWTVDPPDTKITCSERRPLEHLYKPYSCYGWGCDASDFTYPSDLLNHMIYCCNYRSLSFSRVAQGRCPFSFCSHIFKGFEQARTVLNHLGRCHKKFGTDSGLKHSQPRKTPDIVDLPARSATILPAESLPDLPADTRYVRSNGGSSIGSVDSLGSHGSVQSWMSGSRRGRRLYSTRVAKAKATRTSKASRIYQCTFCKLSFPRKSSWIRHEQSKHIPQKVWVCGEPTDLRQLWDGCPFCRHQTFSDLVCVHNVAVCWEKPEQDRTFYRKDCLAQHMDLVHHSKAPLDTYPDEWSRHVPTDFSLLLCPKCGSRFQNHKERYNHLAKHFEGKIR